MFHSLARFGDLRLSTMRCWRRTIFSASSRARLANRDRIASTSRVRDATIGPHDHLRVIPSMVFGRHNRSSPN